MSLPLLGQWEALSCTRGSWCDSEGAFRAGLPSAGVVTGKDGEMPLQVCSGQDMRVEGSLRNTTRAELLGGQEAGGPARPRPGVGELDCPGRPCG